MSAEEIIAFKGEVMLLSWAESHKGGRTGVFLFDDENEQHPLKQFTTKRGKRAGSRFMCVLVELNDDETPVNQKGGPLSQSAARMCENQKFQEFLCTEYEEQFTAHVEADRGPSGNKYEMAERYATQTLRTICNVRSRAELDHDEQAAKRFHELMREFNQRTDRRTFG
jgi:hypothetical protein